MIRWRCVFDGEATPDDFELVRMAGTEIIADFCAPVSLDDEIVVTPYPEKIENLKYLVYLRHEHNYYRGED